MQDRIGGRLHKMFWPSHGSNRGRQACIATIMLNWARTDDGRLQLRLTCPRGHFDGPRFGNGRRHADPARYRGCFEFYEVGGSAVILVLGDDHYIHPGASQDEAVLHAACRNPRGGRILRDQP